jgi:hypothetical protein
MGPKSSQTLEMDDEQLEYFLNVSVRSCYY